MARQQRIEFPGAFYHVIVRSNQRQEIFIDEGDRKAYLERTERYDSKLSGLSVSVSAALAQRVAQPTCNWSDIP